MNRFAFAAAAMIALSACAAPRTVYAPVSRPGGLGYQSLPIEQDRFRVTFRGAPGASAAEVSELALLRAAEIAVERGAPWFRVVSRSGDAPAFAADQNRPRVSIGVGGSSGSYGSSVGIGVGVGFGAGSYAARRAPEITLEVLLGQGAKPSDADVYDARALIDTVGPRVGRS